MACPYCYTKSILPVYHCPKCNEKHDRLWPGPYGILKRTCKCGEKLPTTFFNGRNRLTASCPSCENIIESLEARPVAIPIIGAPSVGKTFFLFSMVYYMKEIFAKKNGYTFEFMNVANKSLYDASISSLNAGMTLRKTTENDPVALNFFLSMNRSKSIFYFYDSAGEAFASTESLARHKFYHYFHGLIFIIDPFSIPAVYHQYESQLTTNPDIKPSSAPLEDVYGALIINIEKNYGVKVTEKITKPVAIAFSKIDAFDLQYVLGDDAVTKLLATDYTIKTEEEARQKVCKTFLENNNMGALARKMEWKFPNSRYFTIHSNGEKSVGIDKLTAWFLGEIDKSYRI